MAHDPDVKLSFCPATADHWNAFEKLFGERGACGGCWCMWWRLPRARFNQQKGAGNRQAMQAIIASGQTPGLLAFAAGEPVGWCALGPRQVFPALERSRILKRVDDEPVWSVVCFFVAKPFRRRGLTVALLKAAVAHARAQGARIVEGYPVEPRQGRMPDAFAYTGVPSAFVQAGFVEVARRSETRPIMRYYLQSPSHG